MSPAAALAVRSTVPKLPLLAACVTAGIVLRAGATIYAGAAVGDDTTIGHNTLLRTTVRVGSGSQLAANLTIERGCVIGDGVRCSPGSHLTAESPTASPRRRYSRPGWSRLEVGHRD
ncbi:hypothetical protein [Streptomyces sp. SID13031]|uniref:hypothetical protein n=1 Tax=Streptomyces sp. SID13031 TaxID=2706046 RepID=UPI0019428DFD